MDMDITVPDEVPVMTLPQVVFFPQSLLPLHIFEPRYRQMLSDVLGSDRLFAVAKLASGSAAAPGAFEPPHRIASIGIVRACQENTDGTSNLLLQGLCRVEVRAIVDEHPYRRIRIRALSSAPPADPAANIRRRDVVARLIALKQKFGVLPGELAEFLKTVDDPETFIDLAAFTVCDSPDLKQRMLETLDVGARLDLLRRRLRREVQLLRLQHRLQGELSDDQIETN